MVFLPGHRSHVQAILEGIYAYHVTHSNWTMDRTSLVEPGKIPNLRDMADGIIVGSHKPAVAHRFVSFGLPCVTTMLPARDLPLPGVCADDCAIGTLAAQYFLQKGLRHFAHCFPASGWGIRQHQGFVAALQPAGLPVHSYDPELDLPWHVQYDRMKAWIGSLPRPVAVLACSDFQGHRILDACDMLGIRIPDEVAVLGVGNNLTVCPFTHPPLSSIVLPAKKAAYQAAAMLDRLMSKQDVAPGLVLLPPVGIVTRQSTDMRVIADRLVAKALQVIAERACDPVSVREILAEVRVSRRTLELRFHKAINRTPHDEIRRVQIDRAKRLLIETKLNIEHIARASGLGDAKYLDRVFRKEVGSAPGVFRHRADLHEHAKIEDLGAATTPDL